MRAGGYKQYYRTLDRLATSGLRPLNSAVASELPIGKHEVEIARVYSVGNQTTIIFRGRAGRTYKFVLDWGAQWGPRAAADIRKAVGVAEWAPTKLVGGKCWIELEARGELTAKMNDSGQIVVGHEPQFTGEVFSVEGIYNTLAEARAEHGDSIIDQVRLANVWGRPTR